MPEPDYTGTDTVPALREIQRLALTGGDVDLAWCFVLLAGREDLPYGARIEDEELARLPAGENVRHGLRELDERGILEVRIERRVGRAAVWHVFIREEAE